MTALELILIHLVTGGAAGFLAGLLGVGGGIIIVPVLFSLFVAFGLDPALSMNLAVGTSLATIVFTSASSMRAHHKRGAVDFSLLRTWGGGILAGAVAGSLSAKYIGGRGLITVFGVLTFLLALNMARKNDLRIATSLPASTPANFSLAAAVGLFSALMGIGGGTLSVPTLSAFSVPMHRAVGTAAAIGLLISVPATFGFLWIGKGVPGRPDFTVGYVNLVGLLLIVPGTTLFAPIGARVAHRLDRIWLRRAFAAFLGLSSLRMMSLLLRADPRDTRPDVRRRRDRYWRFRSSDRLQRGGLMIDRIGHINIRTPILEETLRFYERLLDLRRGISRTLPDDPGNVWLYADNGRAVIHVNQTSDDEPVPDVGARGRLHHVAFDCRDYDAIVKRLEEMNQSYRRWETPVDGMFLLTTVDPNGINVELSFGVDYVIDREMMRASGTR